MYENAPIPSDSCRTKLPSPRKVVDSLSKKSLSHSSGMVCVASPLYSGHWFPGQVRSPGAGISWGGLIRDDLGPEGTSGIPLYSYNTQLDESFNWVRFTYRRP